MHRSSTASRYAELKAEVELLRLSVRAVEFELGQLGPEKGDESLDRRRKREALRRKKAALLIDLDHAISAMSQGSSNKGRIVQGPKSGVRSVVQGGSPGSGKRA